MVAETHVMCQITKNKIKAADSVPIATIRPGILKLMKDQCGDFAPDGYISKQELKRFRRQYIENVLSEEKGELSRLDHEVVKSLVEHETLAKDINSQFEEKMTFGKKLSDQIARFGGSWTFIMLFGGFIFVWIGINTYIILSRPFDPFPFILLNLILSTLAAIQAPIIMMSQNRKDAKDRLRGENDYKVNLKAELEIRNLHEKIDNLTQNQWQHLLEIQQLQLDMMEERQRDSVDPQTGQKRVHKASEDNNIP